MPEVKGKNREVDEFISSLPRNKRRIVNALRDVLFEAEPAIAETIQWGQAVYSKDGTDICHIEACEEHISLGLYRARDLADPSELLDGSWADHKHMKFRTAEDIKKEEFKAWIDEILHFPKK
ncbi:MAG: DUF1801 domain-containing protein [Chloroflexi bacterium]|nr:DUF1801 domain-containing protein [Chloroflexota bacterium]